jgi:CubicO group peptidase (beta-lactamase class C family)
MILERSTGMSVSEYFRTKVWEKVGAQNDASWSLDSEKSGFEKMERA